MGRPAKFTYDQVLDASLTLINEGGPSQLNMTSAAKALGAPSGSIYHRFPSRDILVASLWLRAVERFQTGVFSAMAGPDPLDAAVNAARYVVQFSRDDFDNARLLLIHRSSDLLIAGWPDEVVGRNRAQQARLKEAMSDLQTRLGADDRAKQQRVRFAVIDVPSGAVRGPLSAGRKPSRDVEDLVAEAAIAVLQPLFQSGD